MAPITIDVEKVRAAIKPALAYQPRVEPTVVSETNSPLLIITLPGAQALDLKALESVSTALCGFLYHRGQVGLANGHLCLSFWKDDILKDYYIEQPENAQNK